MEKETSVHSAAKSLLKPITIAFGLFFLLFWSVNIVSLWTISAEAFQRLGSLWVAVLVLVFGFTRLIFSGLQSLADEPSELKKLTFSESSNWFTKKFAPTSEAQAMVVNGESNVRYRAALRLVENQLMLNVYTRELFMLVAATLQWGYGDLLHCWINGNG